MTTARPPSSSASTPRSGGTTSWRRWSPSRRRTCAAGRDAGRRRPQPGAPGPRRQAFEPARRAGAGQRARPGPVRRPQHRHRRGHAATSSCSSTTTPPPARAGSPRCSRPTSDPDRAGGRRRGPPALADWPNGGRRRRAARRRARQRRRHRRARLDRRLHLHRPAHRAGRGAQPHGLQHVVPARGVRARRRLRRGHRPHRQEPAGLRGDRALHPRPAGLGPRRARRSGSCSSRAPRSTTASATTASNGPTCGAAAGPRACPRRPWRSSWARDDALSTERDYVAKVLPAGGRPGAAASGTSPRRRPSSPRWPARRGLRARQAARCHARSGCPRAGDVRCARRPPGRWLSGHRAAPPITSFVHHRARLTEGQQRAWDRWWPVRGHDVADLLDGRRAYDPPAWFGRTAPLILEIGSGMGESTAALAAAEPDVDHLAVEVFEPGPRAAAHADRRGRADQPVVLRGDAVALLPRARAGRLAGRDPDLLPGPVAQAPAPQAPARAARVRGARRVPRCGPAAPCTWPPTGPTTPSRCARSPTPSRC